MSSYLRLLSFKWKLQSITDNVPCIIYNQKVTSIQIELFNHLVISKDMTVFFCCCFH